MQDAHEARVTEVMPAPSPAPPPAPPVPRQAWGEPLQKLDKKWSDLEAKLCVVVLLLEIAALCFWISLKGLSSDFDPASGDFSGLVFRCLITGTLFGLVAHKLTKPKDASTAVADKHAIYVTTAVFVGLFAGRLWARVGVEYFSNLLNWMQDASLFTLVGGLRGLGTRFTLWLALLGASLATAKGKHINVDVVMRFLPPKARVPAAVTGWLAAALVCFAAVVGFADHISISSFNAPATVGCPNDPTKECDVPAGQKLGVVTHAMGDDLFLVGRQLSLDVRSFPRVLFGVKYAGWMSGKDWNDWMRGANWKAHYKAEDVEAQITTDEAGTHTPAINVPGGNESSRGLLIKELNFVFPFGLFMIALRFILRSLLAIAGYIRVDPDAAHEEEEVEEKHPDPEPLGMREVV